MLKIETLKTRIITCNRCGQRKQLGQNLTKADAIQQAKGDGWEEVNGTTMCRTCAAIAAGKMITIPYTDETSATDKMRPVKVIVVPSPVSPVAQRAVVNIVTETVDLGTGRSSGTQTKRGSSDQ